MTSMPEWLNEKFIAHRGYFNSIFPENSLGAFKRAIENGYAIELDVQILKDDTLVVFHDDDFYRMTGDHRTLSNSTYEDIKNLRLLNTDEKIPTFEEMLKTVNGQVPLMIEFKNDSKSHKLEQKSYDILKDYDGPYLIQSFNPMSVLWFKRHAQSIVRGQLSCRHNDGNLNFFKRFIMRNVLTNIFTKPDFVIYDIKALDSWIIKWLKLFHRPLYGYTAKSLEQYQQALACGVKPVFEGFDPNDL